ncbi:MULTISPECIES: anti-sigma factor family protein [Streptomyces]|uniref:anti-sigma factor family protein n=1 Tax=Streptomyces TaxID=1883 RepID=UPI0004CD6186|nr:hypothetical protein [Streptomyces durhamensis]
MSSDWNCDKLREIGAELALGVLCGSERAEAVAHLDGCADCREYIRQLTLVGDRLIGLLPDSDPPPGFETRVARRLAQQAVTQEGSAGARAAGRATRNFRGRARMRLAAVATTLAVAVGFAGWAVGTAVQQVTASAPTTVSEPMLMGDMIAASGRPVGEFYAHPGSPGWIFMSVDLSGRRGSYTGTVACLLERADGSMVHVGNFSVRGGRGDWGVGAPGDLSAVLRARLTSPDGTVLATAHLAKGHVVEPGDT